MYLRTKNMNFLGHFLGQESKVATLKTDRQTGTHTDVTENITMPHSQVVTVIVVVL